MMARENFDAFTAGYYTQYNNTISSGETRIPICFCVDVSESMNLVTNREEELIIKSDFYTSDGQSVRRVDPKPGFTLHHRLEDLKSVLLDMLNRMKRIPILRNSAVVCIVTFSRFADCTVEFSELQNISPRMIDSITVGEDETNAAQGIQMALERLTAMGRIIRNAGNESYRPVFIFMSDGKPTDGTTAAEAGRRLRELSEWGEISVIPIGIGTDSATEKWMKQLSRENRLYRMEYEDEFNEVFSRISSRIHRTAAVISVDEGLVDDDDTPEDDGAAGSRYGVSMSAEEMDDFLRALGDV